MKKVMVEVRRGMVENVELPPGVCAEVVDYDVLLSDDTPVVQVWNNSREDPLLIAAKKVVAKIRKTNFFKKTFLDDTGLLEAIAEAEREEVDDDG